MRANDSGLLLTAFGDKVGAYWEDVVAVGRSENIRYLVLANGSTPWFCQRRLKDATALFALIDERTSDRCYPLRGDEVPGLLRPLSPGSSPAG